MANKEKKNQKKQEKVFESDVIPGLAGDLEEVSSEEAHFENANDTLSALEKELTAASPVYPEFTLIIQDIEKEKDKEFIRKLLSDPKFELNLPDIEDQLAKNKIVVSALSEVQGTLIVQNIKDIDADIRFDLSLKLLPNFEETLPENLPAYRGNLADLRKKVAEKKDPNFIVSTSAHIEEKKIDRYLGIVTAEKIISQKQKIEDISDVLINELILKAKNKGADAILGVNFDVKPYPDNKKLAFTSATAVKLKE
ncbi:MAG: hypothetical protein HYW47_06475 [Deltaproteobacteria bacterium]|nr:hypothetical protein [Deltaproteobacteria bacterium]